MLDFALKRLLKLVVKHSVGKYLQSQPDLNQLDVDLGSGRLELRDALLDCEVLNKDLVRKQQQGERRTCMSLGFCLGHGASCHLTGGPNTTQGNPCYMIHRHDAHARCVAALQLQCDKVLVFIHPAGSTWLAGVRWVCRVHHSTAALPWRKLRWQQYHHQQCTGCFCYSRPLSLHHLVRPRLGLSWQQQYQAGSCAAHPLPSA
jgi:hypothetical protein